MSDPGKTAYEAYFRVCPPAQHPDFGVLLPAQQEAWRAAAKAVKAEAEGEKDDDEKTSDFPSFSAREITPIDNGPGYWNSLNIGVYQHDSKDAEPQLLGTYKRNYSVQYNTFDWTRKGDRYFALYSPDYTSTRVMEIFPGSGFKDIGGEGPDGSGFCPVDLYIPMIREYVNEQYHSGDGGKIKDWSRLLDYFPPGSRYYAGAGSVGRQQLHYPDGRRIQAYLDDGHMHWVYGPEREFGQGYVIYPPEHAFVAGCIWGDDSSWKIQHIDISRIEEGIIQRDERFGYIELPPGLTLKQAILMSDFAESGGRLQISLSLQFDMATGGVLDWNDFASVIEKGRPLIEEQRDRSKNWNHKEFEAEMRRRWAEEGERIKADVLASGGKI